MQVVAGTARRILLKTVPGEATRPTSNRIKETLFNILQPDIQGARFLDLFAGTGAIGIEALSRGASGAVFVEKSRAALSCIRDNLTRTHLADRAEVMETDVFAALRRLARAKRQFDIIFLDPPYHMDAEEETLRLIAEGALLAPHGIVIAEALREKDLSQAAEALGLDLYREKEYKNNKHIFLREKETP